MTIAVTDASNNFSVSVQENNEVIAVAVAENNQTVNISIENPEGDPASVVSTDLMDVVNVQIEDNTNQIDVNTQEVVEQVSVSVSEIAINDHGQSTGLQGGAIGEHYHLNQADYTEAVSFLDGGTSTHTQLDTEKGLSQTHRGDNQLHLSYPPETDFNYTAGLLTSISNSLGTKTFNRDINGVLTSIVGTGIYKTKTFNYTAGKLSKVLVS